MVISRENRKRNRLIAWNLLRLLTNTNVNSFLISLLTLTSLVMLYPYFNKKMIKKLKKPFIFSPRCDTMYTIYYL